MGWEPFVALNMTLIFALGGILWVKFHRLRLSMEAEFHRLRGTPPPILIGEAFLGERFERLEKQMIEARVRLEEIERLMGGEPERFGGSL